ncbi:MAG: type I-C CRISPR-associated protein Cas8c/Csd1 [Planctomycetaceae bacterium]|nr:type I-C CRISPR-associated protein Cas8c/Csd1 [Planctomycetaceae bacterium]
MILQALDELARRENLVPDPDYEVKPVAWMIQLRPDGTLNAILPRRTNLNEGSKKKPKWVGNPMVVPRQPIRTSRALAFFLADKSEYVLGHDPTGKRDAGKLTERLGLLLEQAASCADATGDAGVTAIAAFLKAIDLNQSEIAAAFERDPWEPNDLFAFQLGLDNQPVHLRPAVREFWKKARQAGQPAAAADAVRCLVSGEPVAGAALFPLLKRVPGGTSSGVSLVSFNSRVFESYGLSGNENAPVAAAAAERTSTSLNRLLHDAFPDPSDPQSPLPRRNIRLSADTAVCYWSTTDGSEEFLNAFNGLLTAETEDSVKEAYRSIWRGKPAPVDDPAVFYVLVISGTQGRAVVRDWIETTLGETQRHLAEHFKDLEIVRSARPVKGKSLSPAVPLSHLLSSLAVEGKSENIPASVETTFVRSAFTGQPYPFQLLQRALVRERTEAGRDDWIDAARRDARAALIRAVLQRRRRTNSEAQSRYPEVPVSLNPMLDSEGYSLGALMAVLERLQTAALGDVNATIVDRYFGAASASPRSVFVRLLRNARHHAAKAGDAEDAGKRGHARRLDRMIDHFCSLFEINRREYPGNATGIPMHLDLEQQGLFVLGYHQMRHWLWLPAEGKKEWEAKHPDAPSVFMSKTKTPVETAG